MITYIITGTSSGIGFALAELCLENGHCVIGLSRRVPELNSAENYLHISIDISNTTELDAIDWNSYSIEGEVVLINNAGILGDVGRSENLSANHFERMSAVNIVAPQVLSANILNLFENKVQAILNISSGAGRHAIASWSAYCASKAALDMFSQVLQEELKELNRSTRVYSLAPGVIDTEMQSQIRSSDAKSFSRHEKFVNLKNNKDLSHPNEVAKNIIGFLNMKKSDIICDLRQL